MDILVKKAQRGDAEAFIALIEECKMTLRRVAYGYLGNDEDVADVLQDTILAAYEHISTLKRGEHFKTWLVRILINNCTKVWRHKSRNVSFDKGQEFGIGHTVNIDKQQSDVEFKELLMSLPEDSRAIFQLYYGEQFTTKEIAVILGMNENTIKSKLHRGKEQLREQLS